MLQKYHYKKLLVIIIILSLFSCQNKENKQKSDEILPQKPWEPNLDKRVAKAAEEGRGIFGSKGIFGKADGNSSGGVDFANTNVLWKASLKALDEIPLANVDYAGGIIITDWYSKSTSQKESQELKITIKFLSREVKASSFDVISHKRICVNNNCSINKLGESFNNSIKEKIVAQARLLGLEEKKKN